MSKKSEFTRKCKEEAVNMIHEGLLASVSVDADGNFCYGLTLRGEQAKSKINTNEYTEEEQVKI